MVIYQQKKNQKNFNSGITWNLLGWKKIRTCKVGGKF